MTFLITITVLLLFSGAVKSWESLEVLTDEKEGFKPHLDHRKKKDHCAEEVLQLGAFPGSCWACKAIVSKVKKLLGGDHAKEKIGQLLSKACNGLKIQLIRSACKMITRKYKDKLIDAIAHRGSPRSMCVKLRLCKRSPHLPMSSSD
ncbi:antimicrobial peptide NK-lysin [Cheilinus undulatus]|uniref:antimicrobial peptide NK-lysin n=1 Tax=Cheilinus undulatus TaxID=241271 RepID=UPI001BD2CB95|nr:antimicrobial peptide NK-lysin [Cheilinus undulatus]